MNTDYKCKKCGNIFKDIQSDKFIKTILKKCPTCGSSELDPMLKVVKSDKPFANKSDN